LPAVAPRGADHRCAAAECRAGVRLEPAARGMAGRDRSVRRRLSPDWQPRSRGVHRAPRRRAHRARRCGRSHRAVLVRQVDALELVARAPRWHGTGRAQRLHPVLGGDRARWRDVGDGLSARVGAADRSERARAGTGGSGGVEAGAHRSAAGLAGDHRQGRGVRCTRGRGLARHDHRAPGVRQ